MKNVEIGPIRPPSESNSLLVRVTRGCHWNKCYFCGLYKSIQFSMRPIEETIEDIAKQAQLYKGRTFTSCFLQDGDALVLKTDYLLRILDALNRYFPSLQYITTYARADSITRKTLPELHALRQAGLNHLYCGMETGSDQILKLINKGFQADTVVQSGCMAKEAGMILSEFILLGIGGRELSRLHSRSCHWNKAGIQVGRVCPKRLIYVTIRGRNRRGTEAILATASANGQFLCERAYHQFAFGSARQFADGQGANAFRDRTLFTAPAG